MPRGPRTDTHPPGAIAPAPPSSANGSSPPAQRPSRSRWRDPRLVVGIAVVAVCALLGARFLGGGADTVEVWAARTSLRQGAQVGTGDLQPRQVRFADQADADHYLSAGDGLPQHSTLDRPVDAGDLLPRAALGGAATPPLTEVPLSVSTEAVPATVEGGSTVDVWVTPERVAAGAEPGGAGGPRSTLVLDDVPVVAAPRAGTSLGPTSTRQVIVGVGDDQRRRLPAAIAALSGGDVVLTVQR